MTVQPYQREMGEIPKKKTSKQQKTKPPQNWKVFCLYEKKKILDVRQEKMYIEVAKMYSTIRCFETKHNLYVCERETV